MDLYTFSLHAHSGLRWLVLLFSVIAVVRSIIGWLNNSSYHKFDNIVGASFVGTMHLQLLIGLILYFFLSPITQTAFENFGAAMKNAELRFWAVEHLTLMLLAVILAQLGRTRSKKTDVDNKKFRFQSLFFGSSLAAVLLGMPWDRF